MDKINLEKIKEIIQNKEQYLNSTYLKKNKFKVLKIAIIVVVVLGLSANCAMGYFQNDNNELENIDKIEMSNDEMDEIVVEEDNQPIIVDISGAVLTPMVVELPQGSRINDAIKAAGGLKEKADISNVNRAAPLEDGQKIYIPLKGKKQNNTNNDGYISDNFGQEKVNINTASSEELRTLNGVGPATAEKIIRYREDKGSYKKIEDLKNVDGIGEKTFDKLKDYIVV